jgi:non-specific serine/threonine protein kinase
VQRAAARSKLVRSLVDTQRVFQPQSWTARDAHAFLKDIPLLEESGLLVRVPDWWRGGQAARPRVNVTVGGKAPGGVGLGALLDFNIDLSLDGVALTPQEWADIAAGEGGLVLLKGRWVEVDPEKLRHVLEHWKTLERARRDGGVTFAEGLRLLAGAAPDAATPEPAAADVREWSHINAGEWFAATLAKLRNPAGNGAGAASGAADSANNPATAASPSAFPGLNATLRPYQVSGVEWLHFLAQLGLGACLADDMGLGKTIQVLAFLLCEKRGASGLRTPDAEPAGQPASVAASAVPVSPVSSAAASPPALLVLPASLLGNWVAEAARFAPGLRLLVVHPAETPPETLAALAEAAAATGAAGATAAGKFPTVPVGPAAFLPPDIVLTTYGMLYKHEWLRRVEWSHVILDEAQAIKNPGARQTRVVKELRAPVRVALTGTPVENSLGDLWSIFDFLNPGLLGGAKQFTTLTRRLAKNAGPGAYVPLRNIIRPYILRRLKSDRSVIADLPDKTEVNAHCSLTKKQAVLYEQIVADLGQKLQAAREEKYTAAASSTATAALSNNDAAMQRRGLILATLMRLKQLCNHPAQLTGTGDYAPGASGKFLRLGELCAEIASRQEKALVFTQFRELTAPLQHYLSGVFGRPGLVLHGSIPVKERQSLVAQFQREDGPPFFVLSLKAGGTGLTLTQAAHVLHFDRWWNPAVENQATDRAYRIGQKRNVLVHKFICRGTLEEKIDTLIAGKKALANEVLGAGAGETLLTEMRDDELLNFVRLDLRAAMEE